jgi:hypothetical protein
MSEKNETNIINFPKEPISDEDFAIAINAIFGPYKGPCWSQE